VFAEVGEATAGMLHICSIGGGGVIGCVHDCGFGGGGFVAWYE